MGFLERLISDVVRDNTGVDPRRLIRMVGGKNLLMLGAGAALAGGVVAADRSSSSATKPPPLPPVPTGPPPPLPSAADPGASEKEDEDRAEDLDAPPEVSEAIIRTMIAAGLADGRLSEAEREKVRARLCESNLSAEQIDLINVELIVPASAEALSEIAVVASSPELREVLLRCAIATVAVDGTTSEVEREWLDRLAAVFEIDPGRARELEAEAS